MSVKYQNIGFAADKASFIDAVTNTAGANSLIFANSVKQAPLAGGAKSPMVSGSLTVNIPTSVTVDQAVTVLNESLKIQWNFSRGTTASLTALRAEMNRVLDKAIADYNLTMGLVPPVYADFAVVV